MDLCKTISEAIRCALESEELRLKPRSERAEKPIWPWSLRVYPEAWISYLLVRELSCRCPELKMEPEVRQVQTDSGKETFLDLLICHHARVELKGPHRVDGGFSKGGKDRAILEDFNRQKLRAENDPNLEHFVLLVLHALKSDFDSRLVQQWLCQLEGDVRENNPGICIRLQSSKPLDLNVGNEPPRQMMCCLYSVG